MTLEQLFRDTLHQLPALEARLLMQKAYGLKREDFILNPTQELVEDLLKPLIQRRLAHEPMAYILGEQEFYGLTFKVSSATLIPRSDSECLIESALTALKTVQNPFILDLGTGTGAVLITLLKETQGCGVGVDISFKALEVARDNTKTHGVKALFVQGDFAAALNTQFDLIISNPPYIESDVVLTLQDDVRLYEPHLALDGGKTGLDCYEIILQQAVSLLKPQGALVFEIGQGQEEAIIALAKPHFECVAKNKDLGGIIRALRFIHSF
jgi:release factor glutamine methyltransferase